MTEDRGGRHRLRRRSRACRGRDRRVGLRPPPPPPRERRTPVL